MYFIPCSDGPWPQFQALSCWTACPTEMENGTLASSWHGFLHTKAIFKCAIHFQANVMNGFLIFLHNVLLLYFFKALPLSPVALAFFSLFIHPSSQASSHPERVGVTLPICFQNWSPP